MKSRIPLMLLVALVLSLPLAAQMAIGPRMPDLRGIWNPAVGQGAAYEMTDQNGQKNQMEMTVIGKEDVAGKPGYWMEFAMANPRMGGDMFMKYLVSAGSDGMVATRTIMQMPGRDPMEMDLSTMNRAGRGIGATQMPTDVRDKAELVGTESVTVPAGTFSCQHYRAKDGTGDAWVSDKVGPWGLVKAQGTHNSIVLVKVILDAKDHITGTPKKFDPSMMRQGMGQPGQ